MSCRNRESTREKEFHKNNFSEYPFCFVSCSLQLGQTFCHPRAPTAGTPIIIYPLKNFSPKCSLVWRQQTKGTFTNRDPTLTPTKARPQWSESFINMGYYGVVFKMLSHNLLKRTEMPGMQPSLTTAYESEDFHILKQMLCQSK